MRWPEGPPHMTLKPSKKNKKKQQNQKKKKKKKNKKKNKKKPKILKNELFSYQWKFSFFFGWMSKISLFLQLGPKSAHTKNTIKIGVSGPLFLESSCVSRNGRFWTKKPKFINSSYHFFLPVFFSFNNTKHKKVLKPLFL